MRYAVRLEDAKGDGEGWGALEHVLLYGIQPLRLLLQRLCATGDEGMELNRAQFDILQNLALQQAENLDETCRRLLGLK